MSRLSLKTSKSTHLKSWLFFCMKAMTNFSLGSWEVVFVLKGSVLHNGCLEKGDDYALRYMMNS